MTVRALERPVAPVLVLEPAAREVRQQTPLWEVVQVPGLRMMAVPSPVNSGGEASLGTHHPFTVPHGQVRPPVCGPVEAVDMY